MKKEIEIALSNLWVIVRGTKLLGDEHDQLRNDFALIKDCLVRQKKVKKDKK